MDENEGNADDIDEVIVQKNQTTWKWWIIN